jgi:hypothetical protein
MQEAEAPQSTRAKVWTGGHPGKERETLMKKWSGEFK